MTKTLNHIDTWHLMAKGIYTVLLMMDQDTPSEKFRSSVSKLYEALVREKDLLKDHVLLCDQS